MEFYITLGNKIRNYRINKGISQLELELGINASNGSISRIESGQTNPSKETLLKIASVLNLNFFEKVDLLGIQITSEDLILIASQAKRYGYSKFQSA